MGFLLFTGLGLAGSLAGRVIDRGTGADLAVVGLALAVFGWLAAPATATDWLVDPGIGLVLGVGVAYALWWAVRRWWPALPAQLRQRRIERDQASRPSS